MKNLVNNYYVFGALFGLFLVAVVQGAIRMVNDPIPVTYHYKVRSLEDSHVEWMKWDDDQISWDIGDVVLPQGKFDHDSAYKLDQGIYYSRYNATRFVVIAKQKLK